MISRTIFQSIFVIRRRVNAVITVLSIFLAVDHTNLSYGGLIGDNIKIDYRYPDTMTILTSPGAGPFSVVVGPGDEVPVFINNPALTVDVSNDEITLGQFRNYASYPGTAGLSGPPALFNGPTFTTGREITDVQVSPLSTMVGLDSSCLTWDSHHIWVNWMGLLYDSTTKIILRVQTRSDFTIHTRKSASSGAIIAFPSSPDSYFVLHSSRGLPGGFYPRTFILGSDSSQEGSFQLPIAPSGNEFLTVEKISTNSSRSLIGDGIADIWKLRHNLDPMDPSVTSAKPLGETRTWGEIYSDELAQADLNQIRKLILSIPKISVANNADVILGTRTDTETEGFRTYTLTYEKHLLTQQLERIVAFDPNADSLFPGAIVQGKDLPEGILTSISMPREPLTITLTDLSAPAGVILSTTVDDPRLSTVSAGIRKILHGSIDVNQPGKISFYSETVNSVKEAALKLGASADWFSGTASAFFSTKDSQAKSHYLVRFVQSYFTAACELPTDPVSYISAGASYQSFTNYVGDVNPPAFVASVTFGRELWMLIESAADASSLQAALNVAFSSGFVNGQIDLSVSQKTIIEQSTVQVLALGGSGTPAILLLTSDKVNGLKNYLTAGANFSSDSPGAPISYTVRYLRDNSLARVSAAADYEVLTDRRLSTPRLTDAYVHFHTNDDDKDSDTTVQVIVANNSGQTVAQLQGGYGHFDDNSDNNISLSIINEPVATELSAGRVTVIIGPNGNDTWKFNVDVILRFSDGNTLVRTYNGAILSEGRTEFGYW
jgi:hypothetical protein